MKLNNPFTENDYQELLEACEYIMGSCSALYVKTHYYLTEKYEKYCSEYDKRGIIYKYFNKKASFDNYVYEMFYMYKHKVDKHNLLSLHNTKLDFIADGYMYRQRYNKPFNTTMWFCVGINQAETDEELELIRLSSAFPSDDENFIKFYIQLKQYSVNPPVFDFDEITYCKIILGYYVRLKTELEK